MGIKILRRHVDLQAARHPVDSPALGKGIRPDPGTEAVEVGNPCRDLDAFRQKRNH